MLPIFSSLRWHECEFQCIGATTLNEYRKHIEKDAALERRFQPILVDEPSLEESIEILKGIRDRYEAHHGVKISDDAIATAVRLSSRYISDRFLPDKAIDLIDEAASRVRLASFILPPEIKELEARMDDLTKEKEEAINAQEYEKAAQLRDEEQRLRDQVDNMRKDWWGKGAQLLEPSGRRKSPTLFLAGPAYP